MSESSEILRMTIADGAAIAEKAKTGDPSAIRRFVLFSAWGAIHRDKKIPSKKKPLIFKNICENVDVEVVKNG